MNSITSSGDMPTGSPIRPICTNGDEVMTPLKSKRTASIGVAVNPGTRS
jgi:hypothetical protein